MTRFACDRCGKCCRSFGAFITIERQLNSRDYYCRYGITKEIFPVKVEPGFEEHIAGIFDTGGRQETAPAAQQCCFLVKDPSGTGFACAVYSTRPAVCRNFRCYRMLIYHAESGRLSGKVIGQYQLRTENETLGALWDREIAALLPEKEGRYPGRVTEKGSDLAWPGAVLEVLERNGYRGDPVDD